MKTYDVGMNRTGAGGRSYVDVLLAVQANSEFEAIQKAQQQYPHLKVCYIKQR